VVSGLHSLPTLFSSVTCALLFLSLRAPLVQGSGHVCLVHCCDLGPAGTWAIDTMKEKREEWGDKGRECGLAG
jgi:hypothetical protein